MVLQEISQAEDTPDDFIHDLFNLKFWEGHPLALPIFVIKADKLNPANLQMYRVESKEGHRELTASSKKTADPIHVQVTRLSGDNLYQLDVYNSLDAGEYALTAEGSTRMFCFQVY